MTWRERRLISILSAILAILMAAVVITLGVRYQRRRAAAERQPQEESFLVGESGYTALRYSNGAATLSFAQEGETWVWSDDADFPLDDSTVTAILDTLSTLKPQQTITDADTLATCGFDDPAATLTAETAQGSELRLVLGKTTTDGQSYYAQMNRDRTKAYIIDGALYELMSVPIYDMCALPELPELTEDNLQSITLRGPAAEDGGRSFTFLAARHEEDGATVWHSASGDVSRERLVRTLLEDLSALAFERCIDYRPSEAAAAFCGFESPTAEAVIDYTDAQGALQTVTLTIGDRLADGTGRYVRLDGGEAIYFLPTALMDPLVPIAINSLDALLQA
ncbi:MAG: DUF4340 domain-containing protein [Oscillibacter sp.]|nr:DUF4340 domain-containing protein [Oscillibacter sp.]